MRDAIADLVRDGDTVAIEGFTHLISFSAGHEIIRQRKRELTLARLTPDLIYDQMIAGGVASKLVFSWLGNPGVGGLGAIRRRIEGELPDEPLEIEEYSHFGMVGRYTAGAMNLPFFPLRSYFETDLPVANPLIRPIESPYGEETIYAVPPLKPDVAIVHAQRASAGGDTQVWGLLGCQKEAAFAADRVIIVVEELVDEAVIRADPNRTIIPGLIVDAVVVEPWGAHPSYVQGAYDRDNRFYLDWDPITRDEAAVQAWLRDWVLRPGRAGRLRREARVRAAREPEARLRTVRRGRLRGLSMTDSPAAARSLMILVAGPYRSGTDGDPARIAANVEAMTRTSLALYRRGHLPVMGEWFALPLIEQARAQGDPGDADAEIFHPIAEQVLARCDAVLRIGGPSEGADRMVATAERLGKTVYTSLEAVP